MKNKDIFICTKHLKMVPRSQEHPLDCIWDIFLCDNSANTTIGELLLRPSNRKWATILEYELDERYDTKYHSEVLKGVSKFIFMSDDNLAIKIIVENENGKAIAALKKNHAECTVQREDNSVYVLEKPDSMWMFLYLCVGVFVGFIFGSVKGNALMGVCIGMCFGVGVGMLFDRLDKKNRDKYKESC